MRYTNGALSGWRSPGSSVDDVVATLTNWRVSQVVNRGVTTSYGYAGLTTTRTRGGVSESYVFDASGNLLSHSDALNAVTSYEYTGGALTEVTRPEGDYTVFVRDARGNATQTVVHAKGNASTITTSAGYDATCADRRKCNAPNTVTDAAGGVTDYDYDAATGELTAVRSPAPAAGGVRPEVRYGYTSYGGVRLLTSVSACRTVASCAGTADESRTTIGYGSVASSGLRPVTVTRSAGDGSLAATSAVTYDAVGNVIRWAGCSTSMRRTGSTRHWSMTARTCWWR